MSRTLFALCRVGNVNEIFRIPLEAGVQNEVEEIFTQQEIGFFEGTDEAIEFTGDWKADPNELLAIQDPDLVKKINETRTNGAGAYSRLDLSGHENAGIKALFMISDQIPDHILFQRFTSTQYLQKKHLTLTYSNNQFGKLVSNGFSLSDKLAAVIKGDNVLFKSFHVLRSFLTVQHHFEEATNDEIESFAQHPAFLISDEDLFSSHMDERCRKLIRGIKKSNVLEDHQTSEIIGKAASVGLNLNHEDGRIVLPSDKKDLKVILSFLEESVYKGIFSEETFLTNSKRSVA